MGAVLRNLRAESKRGGSVCVGGEWGRSKNTQNDGTLTLFGSPTFVYKTLCWTQVYVARPQTFLFIVLY